MNQLSHLTANTLLENESFVRAVARGLLRDEHAADDVTQDVLLRSLEQGAPTAPRGGGMRAWIAAVTRNAVRDSRRREARRAEREEGAARIEAQESVALAFERLSLQREIVGEILALAEPYRTVVLLRYYHDLEPIEIAERLGSKSGTVRTQLVRAHELLRTRLDAQRDRRAWAALLIGDGASAHARPIPWGGIGATAAAAILGTAAFLALRHESNSPPVVAGAGSDYTVAAVHALELVEPSVPSSARETHEVAENSVRAPVAQTSIALETTSFPRAELFDRQTYRNEPDSYERATFSFEHGLRDDPGNAITRNDWDLLFGGGKFGVRTVVDDSGLIVDLGRIRLTHLAASDRAALRTAVASIASTRFRPENHGVRDRGETAPVEFGHTYFVWTRDSDTDALAAFEVLEFQPGHRCLLEWYGSKDGITGRGSIAVPSGTEALLNELRESARAQAPLREPRVHLQARAQMKGGNPNAIDMTGFANAYVDHRDVFPFDAFAPIAKDERSRVYCEGGFVPPDRTFVVTRVTWSGFARGDSNGSGGFHLVVGGKVLAEQGASIEPIQGVWTGSIEIAPGAERKTRLAVFNSSSVDALLEGHWKP